jgi:hypothetical protein
VLRTTILVDRDECGDLLDGKHGDSLGVSFTARSLFFFFSSSDQKKQSPNSSKGREGTSSGKVLEI